MCQKLSIKLCDLCRKMDGEAISIYQLNAINVDINGLSI